MKGHLMKPKKEARVCKLSNTADRRECNNNAEGGILRVKHGYNPNSSSMGSIVFALPAALLGITAVFGVVSGLIVSAFMKDGRKSDSPAEAPDKRQAKQQHPEQGG